MVVWLLVPYVIGFTAVTTFVAHEKGRDAGPWLAMGLLFGIFAFLAVAAAPPVWAKPNAGTIENAERTQSVGKSAEVTRKEKLHETGIVIAVLVAIGVVVAIGLAAQ